ncbi:hypothetical protein ROZALSC1DRAFT_30967 [Rozella allomycis CSF55]|uniref:Copper transport protein 86 n=1 Tax=Rozella allomycis (strain CSF55) TaxID=988480 RepID=A0A075AUE9_ROZAC|nr:hypothetical protein O9G_002612 [Rozella allomycis CSF55]RKP17200.1 hypothetical protein ROZALSC1DRAFT_30967 [Rozella allomycis CSF55]|eukprot:EPZ32117.1 hypothetical protein O9G_002612 [Rozella allomycis CSF55]
MFNIDNQSKIISCIDPESFEKHVNCLYDINWLKNEKFPLFAKLIDIIPEFIEELSAESREFIAERSPLKLGVLKLVANLSHENESIKAMFTANEYMTLLQTFVRDDDSNPLLREWAIFAIRNLSK